jgi:hypothetical protein
MGRAAQERMSKGRKVWLGVLAGTVAFVTAFLLWASWKSDQIVAGLKSIADRLQTEPGWENLDTQPPVGAALYIPLDGPRSQYAYRWDTDYGQDDDTNIVQIVVNKYCY